MVLKSLVRCKLTRDSSGILNSKHSFLLQGVPLFSYILFFPPCTLLTPVTCVWQCVVWARLATRQSPAQCWECSEMTLAHEKSFSLLSEDSISSYCIVMLGGSWLRVPTEFIFHFSQNAHEASQIKWNPPYFIKYTVQYLPRKYL